jgi:hypothetical protein
LYDQLGNPLSFYCTVADRKVFLPNIVTLDAIDISLTGTVFSAEVTLGISDQ